MLNDLPLGYFPSNIDNKIFFKSLKKDKLELKKFFDCAIKDNNFWSRQTPELKNRLIKLIEKSNDINLLKDCIHSIDELSTDVFDKIFEDVENPLLISFFKGQIELSDLSKENLDDILSFSSFIQSQNQNQNSVPQNSQVILNYMLSKKFNNNNIITALNSITKEMLSEENFKIENLPQLLEIAQVVDAEIFLNNCSQFLQEKICEVANHPIDVFDLDAQTSLQLTPNSIFFNMYSVDMVNLDQLEKFAKIFENTKMKLKISLTPIKPQNPEDFLSFIKAFKNNIFELWFCDGPYLKLPEEVCLLENLQSLQINNCPQLVKLPKQLGSLKNLQSLIIDNSPVMLFSESIGGLTNLQTLSLSNLQLNELPDSIGQLKNLRRLNLSNLPLNELPDSIGQLKNLRSLNLSNLQLSTLPDSINGLSKLEVLNLSKFSVIPDSIGELTNLQSLNLSYLPLRELPKTIGQLKNLRSLNLSNLPLNELPDSIGQLKNLQSLILSNLQLSTLPDSINGLSKLEVLNLSSSKFSVIPDSIGELTNLQSLNLSDLALTELPDSIGKLINLQSLNLSNLQLLTSLPDSLEALRLLQYLNISNCTNLKTICSFKNFNQVLQIHLPNNLDGFLSLKILFDLGDTSKKREMYLNQLFSQSDFLPILKAIIYNLNFYDVNMHNFISNIDVQNSSLFLLPFFLALGRIIPDKKNEIISLLFDKSNTQKIIGYKMFTEFVATNQKYFLENFEINNFEKYQLGIQLGIKIDNPNILTQVFTDYFESDEKEFHNTFILTDQVKDFFKSDVGKEILIRFKDRIFENNQDVVKFIKTEFPSQDEQNHIFYPITIFENRNFFSIQCIQKQIRKTENIKEILTKIANLNFDKDFKVHYLDQIGVDAGALKRDFISNLFEAAAECWDLNKKIPKTLNHQLPTLLGNLLKYIFHNEEVVTGEVFHDSFFKGMVQFTYDQIISNKLDNDEILKIATSGYNTDDENIFIDDILNFLEWSGLSENEDDYKNIATLMKCSVHASFDPELISLMPKEIFKEEEDPLTGEKKYIFVEDKDVMAKIQTWIEQNDKLGELKEIIRDEILEGYYDQIRNLHSLLVSLSFTEDEWNKIKSEGSEALKLKIQGGFSKEKFLEKIDYKDTLDPSATIGLDPGTVEFENALIDGTRVFDKTIKKYLKEWFDEADENTLKKFAKYVTGSPTVPFKNINFFTLPEYYEQEVDGIMVLKPSQFQIHACFNHVDVPLGLTKEQITFYLNSVISDKEASFDLA